MTEELKMIATGELMLLMDSDPETYFSSIAPVLRGADIVVGHLETLHTERPAPAWDPMHPAPSPSNLAPLVDANFSLLTLAGNPSYCYGPPGIIDTTEWLDAHGIGHVGAGLDIDEAIKPAIVARDGQKVGFLNYDTVGTKENGASPTKPGVAFVDVLTHYEPARLTGMAPQVFTWPEPWSLRAMREDVARLRGECDVLVVAFHMGLGGQEVVLPDYERPLVTAAIDAGADVVLGTHCHILKGVEFYRGKPIFHCLGNIVVVTPEDGERPAALAEIEPMASSLAHDRMRGVLDGGLGRYYNSRAPQPTYRVDDPRNYTALFQLAISDGAVSRISCVPCLIDEHRHPVVVGKGDDGERIIDYLRYVTDGAGLNAEFTWDGDEIVITERA